MNGRKSAGQALLMFVFFVLAGILACVWKSEGEEAQLQELVFGPGGCPVPWSVDWCSQQVGENAAGYALGRRACVELAPKAETETDCLRAMADIAATVAEVEPLYLPPPEVTGRRIQALPGGERFGVEYTPAATARACWGDTTGRCPEWLAKLTGGSCCRRIDLSAVDPALESLECKTNSGAGGAVSLEWLARRYGKGPLGHFQGWGQELFWQNRQVLECRFSRGELGGPELSGVPSHRECYDLAAVEKKPANACEAPPPPPPLKPVCGDGTCNGLETCSSCPADCGECSPPPPSWRDLIDGMQRDLEAAKRRLSEILLASQLREVEAAVARLEALRRGLDVGFVPGPNSTGRLQNELTGGGQ